MSHSAPAIDCVIRLDELRAEPRTVEIVASPEALEALARDIGVERILECRASLRVAPVGDNRAHVTGEVRARLVQICVVSLEPFETELIEPVDVSFGDATEVERVEGLVRAALAADSPAPDIEVPDLLVDGRIDLGALVQEFLVLGVDPYPRKPGVAFDDGGAGDTKESPFSVLTGWRPGGPKSVG